MLDGGKVAQRLLPCCAGTGYRGRQHVPDVSVSVGAVNGDPVGGGQARIPPSVVAIQPVYVENDAGDVRRRVVLDVAMPQGSFLRTDIQAICGTVGAVGPEGQLLYK